MSTNSVGRSASHPRSRLSRMSLRWLVLATGIGAGVVWSSTFVPSTLEERLIFAQAVVVGRVVAAQVVRVGSQPQELRTRTTLLAEKYLKGSGPRSVVVEQIGGDFDGWSVHVPGDAEFAIGERVLCLLMCPTPERCALVALGQGKYSLAADGSLQNTIAGTQPAKMSFKTFEAALQRAGDVSTQRVRPAPGIP